MKERTARRLAWSLWGLFWAVVIVTLLLAVVGGDSGTSLGEWTVLASYAAFATVGALIASRQPRNSVGWILCLLGLGFASLAFADTYSRLGLTGPRSLPAAVYTAWFYDWAWYPVYLAITLPLLLFPTGSLPSARWKPVGWLAMAAIGLGWIPLALLPGRFQDRPVENPFGLESAEGLVTAAARSRSPSSRSCWCRRWPPSW